MSYIMECVKDTNSSGKNEKGSACNERVVKGVGGEGRVNNERITNIEKGLMEREIKREVIDERFGKIDRRHFNQETQMAMVWMNDQFYDDCVSLRSKWHLLSCIEAALNGRNYHHRIKLKFIKFLAKLCGDSTVKNERERTTSMARTVLKKSVNILKQCNKSLEERTAGWIEANRIRNEIRALEEKRWKICNAKSCKECEDEVDYLMDAISKNQGELRKCAIEVVIECIVESKEINARVRKEMLASIHSSIAVNNFEEEELVWIMEVLEGLVGDESLDEEEHGLLYKVAILIISDQEEGIDALVEGLWLLIKIAGSGGSLACKAMNAAISYTSQFNDWFGIEEVMICYCYYITENTKNEQICSVAEKYIKERGGETNTRLDIIKEWIEEGEDEYYDASWRMVMKKMVHVVLANYGETDQMEVFQMLVNLTEGEDEEMDNAGLKMMGCIGCLQSMNLSKIVRHNAIEILLDMYEARASKKIEDELKKVLTCKFVKKPIKERVRGVLGIKEIERHIKIPTRNLTAQSSQHVNSSAGLIDFQ